MERGHGFHHGIGYLQRRGLRVKRESVNNCLQSWMSEDRIQEEFRTDFFDW